MALRPGGSVKQERCLPTHRLGQLPATGEPAVGPSQDEAPSALYADAVVSAARAV
ncbi:hypothetical protein ACFCXT_13485 [Streptomyces vinaceus]|uniref:hypothetical protein n=1 Tax=Streptomyces vinaceus TaxID=1960 RepID=UPI0035D6490B